MAGGAGVVAVIAVAGDGVQRPRGRQQRARRHSLLQRQQIRGAGSDSLGGAHCQSWSKKTVKEGMTNYTNSTTYVLLREGNKDIQLQEALLRFKKDKDVDVTYRITVRTTNGNIGLIELTLACPGSRATTVTNGGRRRQLRAARCAEHTE
ncbi:hypothetical protein ACX80V_08430 [Arthrobacter sp. MDT3-24]